jgi:hypothetical protein
MKGPAGRATTEAPGSRSAASTQHPRRPHNTTRRAGLACSHLLNAGAANYLPRIPPAVLVSLHEPVPLARILTRALITGQAAQPPVGWIADRLGRRSLAISGLLLTSIAAGLVRIAHATWALLVLLRSPAARLSRCPPATSAHGARRRSGS